MNRVHRKLRLPSVTAQRKLRYASVSPKSPGRHTNPSESVLFIETLMLGNSSLKRSSSQTPKTERKIVATPLGKKTPPPQPTERDLLGSESSLPFNDQLRPRTT